MSQGFLKLIQVTTRHCEAALFLGSLASMSLQGCGGDDDDDHDGHSHGDGHGHGDGDENTTMTWTMTMTTTMTMVATPAWWSRSPSNDGCLRVPLWSEILYHTHSRGDRLVMTAEQDTKSMFYITTREDDHLLGKHDSQRGQNDTRDRGRERWIYICKGCVACFS